MKNTKRSVLVSGLCLLLTAVMLMGSTFAWFTDSVTNEGNTIQSGTLDISLNNGDETTLFSSENFLFEPGRSQKAVATVTNEGSLWLKYAMHFANVKITGNGDITEVLDVYKVAADAASLEGAEHLGTMKELMAAGRLDEEGVLAPKGYTGNDGVSGETFTLVIKMQESAGNQYQGCGVAFDVVVNATQYTYEQDGFGNPDYDKDVTYIPDEVQGMAADLDSVADAGAGVAPEAMKNNGYAPEWFKNLNVNINYVTGFKDGKFVVRVNPSASLEGEKKLAYVVVNVRGAADDTLVCGEWTAEGQETGNNLPKTVVDLGNGWYEYSCSTYEMGEEIGYTICAAYYGQGVSGKGEAYIKAGTGWNFADYVHVANACNNTNVVEAGKDAAANGVALENALTNAEAGDTIILEKGTYSGELTISQGVTLEGNGATLTDKIQVNADDVTLENVHLAIPVAASETASPIQTNNNDLTLVNCTIERTTMTAQPYGMLVNVGTGVLTAENTVFVAPYDPETAFNASPSMIEAGEVYLDGCRIETDGYGLFSQHAAKGVIRNTVFTGVEGRPTLGCLNSTVLNGMVFDGCTFEMGKNSTVAAGNFTMRNCTFDFTNTPADGAGNGINLYAQNGNVVLENNTFRLTAGKTGINLTSASWASGGHDASQVTISGNVFEGTGATAIKIAAAWENEKTVEEYEQSNVTNGNAVVINN